MVSIRIALSGDEWGPWSTAAATATDAAATGYCPGSPAPDGSTREYRFSCGRNDRKFEHIATETPCFYAVSRRTAAKDKHTTCHKEVPSMTLVTKRTSRSRVGGDAGETPFEWLRTHSQSDCGFVQII
jgi:hypothetical protein